MSQSNVLVLEILQFVDGAHLVVVGEREGQGVFALSAWNGSATVNTAVVDSDGFKSIDCWTDYRLTEMVPVEREALLRTELCIALDLATVAMEEIEGFVQG